jgi:hypothetical protein
MTLEERYNAAGNETYVGRVKSFQAGGEAGAGVNFLDGDGRGAWSPDATAAPDEVQTEFTKNAAGDFRYGGGGKVAGTYSLSRWLQKGVDKGDTYLTNNRFTTINDVRNANTIVQKYNGLSGKDFITKLGELSKGKVNGGAVGPSPAGLGG